ncbi:hypothetical protein HPP92_019710 [Vanilla planifolia]|uniref:Ribulose bisphosphate carboxylase small subunit n=1 Tax=Vanilla planifolia TaxID=51239 RepID=A0A835Q3D6_VANPL|nr:hypothetical protein HPP92_019710 [Vanilla planifolia]
MASTMLPGDKRHSTDLSHLPSNGRIRCMLVAHRGKKKFERLSTSRPLRRAAAEADRIPPPVEVGPCLNSARWVSCRATTTGRPGTTTGGTGPWKLPMFRCTDAVQVAKELQECKKEYPDAFVRIIGFDNVRQARIITPIGKPGRVLRVTKSKRAGQASSPGSAGRSRDASFGWIEVTN